MNSTATDSFAASKIVAVVRMIFIIIVGPIIFPLFVLEYFFDQEGRLEQKLREGFLNNVCQVEASIKENSTHQNYGLCSAATGEDNLELVNLSSPLLMPFASSQLQFLNCDGNNSNFDLVFHVQLQKDSTALRSLDPKFRILKESSTLSLEVTPCRDGGWSLRGTRISETAEFKINKGHIVSRRPGDDGWEAYWVETVTETDCLPDDTAKHPSNFVQQNEQRRRRQQQQKEIRDIFQRERYPQELLVVGKFKDTTSSSNCFEGDWILSNCALRGRFDVFERASSSSTRTSTTVPYSAPEMKTAQALVNAQIV